MSDLKLRKILNKLPKTVTKQNPFSIDMDSLRTVEYKSHEVVGDRIVFSCMDIDTAEELKVTRNWSPGGSVKDPSIDISNKIQLGDILILKDLEFTNNVSQFSGASPVYKSQGNVSVAFHKNRPFFVDNYVEYRNEHGETKRTQKYYLLNAESSRKVNSSKEAIKEIRDILMNGKLNESFMVRGYSSSEKLAVSYICKDSNNFKDRVGNYKDVLTNFLTEQQRVDMVSFDVEKTEMTGSTLLSLIDENTDSVWEIIPVTYYIKSLMPKDNPALAVSLLANSEKLSQAYTYEEFDAYRNTFLGIKTIEYKDGKFYNDIITPYHSDKESALPLALVATQFANPKFALGFAVEELEQKEKVVEDIPDGVDLITYALSLNNEEEEIDNDFNFTSQFQAPDSIQSRQNEAHIEKNKDIFDELIEEFHSKEKTPTEQPADDDDFEDEFDINAVASEATVDTNDEESFTDDFEDEFDINSVGIQSSLEQSGGLEAANNTTSIPEIVNPSSDSELSKQENTSVFKNYSDHKMQIAYYLPQNIKDGIGKFMLKKLQAFKEMENGIWMQFSDPMSDSKLQAAVRNLNLPDGSFKRGYVENHEYFLELRPKNDMNLASTEPKYSEEVTKKLDESDSDDILDFLRNNVEALNKSMGI